MDLTLLLKAAVMGVVEGLTEFLPISSTGHLILAGALLGFDDEKAKVFDIAIQTGAILAVIIVYWQKISSTVVALPTQRLARRFALNVLIAFVPAVVLGLLLAASISTWAVLLSQSWRLHRVHHDLNLSKALFWQAPDLQQGLQVLQYTEKEGLLSRLAQAAQAPLAGTLAASTTVTAQAERALRDALHQASARLHHGHTFLASVAACDVAQRRAALLAHGRHARVGGERGDHRRRSARSHAGGLASVAVISD